MSKLLALDNEQEAMMRQTIGAGLGFLRARSERVDPEGIVTASYELQARKLDNLIHQLDLPPLAAPNDFTQAQIDQITRLAQALIDAKKPHYAAVVMQQLRDQLMTIRQDPEVISAEPETV